MGLDRSDTDVERAGNRFVGVSGHDRLEHHALFGGELLKPLGNDPRVADLGAEAFVSGERLAHALQ